MSELIIRPTMKFVYVGYAVVVLLVLAALIATIGGLWPAWIGTSVQRWVPLVPVVLLFFPLRRHIQTRLTRMIIVDDKLRYESGLLSKTTRTILISRVQHLIVSQTVGQRVLGVGDLSIETAGETSRLTISGIDRPQEVADHINELSQQYGRAMPHNAR